MSTEPTSTIWDNSLEVYSPNNFKVYWETLEPVREYQFKTATGSKTQDYIGYVIDYVEQNIGSKDLNCLFIGCTEVSQPEIRLMETGLFAHIEVMDVAAELLERQQVTANKKGIVGLTYTKQDLNQVVLDKNRYDLILAVGTVHHLENLEGFFEQVQQALTEDGIFVMREYVGPNRLQYSNRQILLVKGALRFIPKQYRLTADNTIKWSEKRVNIEHLIKLDPSESVRSNDIMPVLRHYLQFVHLANTGGTLLHPLLSGIAGNFEMDQMGETILRLLIFSEKALIKIGLLPSDYVFCIARKTVSQPVKK